MTRRLAVLFDVDGVLVDSYAAHFESWRTACEQYGLAPMSEAEFVATFGRTSREIIAEHWGPSALSTEKIAELDGRKEADYRRIVEANFPAMEGARSLIAGLHEADFALAAGSSGPPENVELALNQLGQRTLFDVVVTGDDVIRGKPDPQVFQLCAAGLDVAPHNCAVIEDAPAGITAANRAGMTSIALVSAGHSRDEFSEAAHVVERLSELSPVGIRGWIEAAG